VHHRTGEGCCLRTTSRDLQLLASLGYVVKLGRGYLWAEKQLLLKKAA